MKKRVIFMAVVMFVIIPSVAMAGGLTGVLYLFQKCDATLANTGDYDGFGCPTIVSEESGPWPILPDKKFGVLTYNLWGDKFKFLFAGCGLDPATTYTLIYYPDPWPGENLICLGSGTTSSKGKLKISGKVVIPYPGLPQDYDANYSPIFPSGAVGAKIWLVLSEDVQCEATNNPGAPQLIDWLPSEYLFEYNLINFESTAAPPPP